MRIHSLVSAGGALVSLRLTLVLLLIGFCYCHDKSIEVIGLGECSDCAQNNIKTEHALLGLHISIDCKVAGGNFKTRGVSQLDKDGTFKVVLPSDIVKDNGELKEECFARLHSASKAPCVAINGLEASKIVFKSNDKGKLTFNPSGKLVFSPATCTSAFLWSYYKYPPLPKLTPHPVYTESLDPKLPPKYPESPTTPINKARAHTKSLDPLLPPKYKTSPTTPTPINKARVYTESLDAKLPPKYPESPTTPINKARVYTKSLELPPEYPTSPTTPTPINKARVYAKSLDPKLPPKYPESPTTPINKAGVYTESLELPPAYPSPTTPTPIHKARVYTESLDPKLPPKKP